MEEWRNGVLARESDDIQDCAQAICHIFNPSGSGVTVRSGPGSNGLWLNET